MSTLDKGTHVRAVADYEDGDTSRVRLTLQVWPLPSEEVTVELAALLRNETHKFLAAKNLASLGLTHLTAVGPMQ